MQSILCFLLCWKHIILLLYLLSIRNQRLRLYSLSVIVWTVRRHTHTSKLCLHGCGKYLLTCTVMTLFIFQWADIWYNQHTGFPLTKLIIHSQCRFWNLQMNMIFFFNGWTPGDFFFFYRKSYLIWDFWGDPSGKETRQFRRHKRHQFNPWVGRYPGRGHGNSLE